MNNIEKLKNELIEQRNTKFPGNIYHVTQVLFAYNSNKIEGSRLTEEQTEMIFETNSFIAKDYDVIKTDDITEAVNHFRLFDYILDVIDKPLTKEMIIEMNKIIKRGTSDEFNPRYNVGGFKVLPNVIGLTNVIKTSRPENVENDINDLLFEYENRRNIDIEDIILSFISVTLATFFVIKCSTLLILNEYGSVQDGSLLVMIDTCLNEQDIYKELCKQLLNMNFENGKTR